MEFYLATVRFDKTMETGEIKKVKEQYLFDAMSYTEAERRVQEEIQPFMSGEWEIADITRPRFAELVLSDNTEDDRYYKVKMAFITIDERTGTEKRTNQVHLVQASDLRRAIKRSDENMKTSMSDYVLLSVAETPIMDYYPYEQKE